MRIAVLFGVCIVALSAGALPPIEIVAPQSGDVLSGGGKATLEWRAELPSDVEEWEAFLSVDGGRYYGARITPHLDRNRRRVEFDVPNVAATDARILLRFGDERRETEVELPLRMAIAFDPWAPLVRHARESRKEGEPARVGDAPVAIWSAGPRDGSVEVLTVHRVPSCGPVTVRAIALPCLAEVEALEDFADHALIVIALPPPNTTCTAATIPRRAARARDLLLNTKRLNI